MLLLIFLMMRVVVSFLLKLNSHHPDTFASPLQQTLNQNYRASHNCYSVKNMVKLLLFKWLLNELLVETEWSEIMLFWWLVWIILISSFLKISFQYIYSNKAMYLVISTSLEKLSLFHLQISCHGSTVLLFFCFFSLECLIFFFSFFQFFKRNCKTKV